MTSTKLQSLIASLSFHDFYTYDHSINVSMYCICPLLSKQDLKPPKEEVVMAGLGGLLHDIGKIKIATDIINKPDKLTEEQFAISSKSIPDFGLENLMAENSLSRLSKESTLTSYKKSRPRTPRELQWNWVSQ
jgi:response regulator RpfG family c-di-GMP phosphodiesterase